VFYQFNLISHTILVHTYVLTEIQWFFYYYYYYYYYYWVGECWFTAK